MSALQVKKLVLFLFCLSCFFLPGQNWVEISDAIETKSARIWEKIPEIADYPENKTSAYPQNISAKAALVLDADSRVVLWQKNENARLFPASTIKIMTALVVLEKYHLDQYLLVDDDYENGQTMELEKGEIISVRNLLYGLLVSSANDAAAVLAKNYPGGEKKFIEAMNKKAKELNLENSYFANPTGLDSDEEEKVLVDFPYSTVKDLGRLALAAMKNTDFAKIVRTQNISIGDSAGKIAHNLTNLNLLLGKVPGVLGIKTGWTEEAGECLITFTERDGRKILLVVLGSEDRFGETEKLIDWVFGNYQWEKIIPAI